MAITFHIKNFDRLQHYKDRSPPWIKLYNGLLDDYAFAHLPDASKAHLLAIGLLASRYSNKIPLDADWIAKRINATCAIDLKALIESGFIIPDQVCSTLLADRLQDAIPEREGETEESRETITTTTNALAAVAVAGFDDFFKEMPRRWDRPASLTAYGTALTKTTHEILVTAAKRYAATAGGFETRYILPPAKWLDGERWHDGMSGTAESAFNSPEEVANQKRLMEKHYGNA